MSIFSTLAPVGQCPGVGLRGYDNSRVYAECEERGCEPVIPLRGAKANQPALRLALGGRLFPRIPRHTQRLRDLYRGRAAR